MDKNMNALRQFLNSAHSPYHATAALEKELVAAGYTRLQEEKAWNLTPGGKYYLTRNGSSIAAAGLPVCSALSKAGATTRRAASVTLAFFIKSSNLRIWL